MWSAVSTLHERGYSVYRATVGVVVLTLVAVLLWLAPSPLSPPLLAMLLLTVVYVVANVFDAVREHPLYHVASALWTTTLFALWYLADSSVFAGVFAVVMAVGVLVEVYNYRHGTSYLRVDLTG